MIQSQLLDQNIGGTDTQNDATLTLTNVGATTFSNVTQASTSGNGSGAIFTISIDGSGNSSVASVNSGGSGYEPDDTITVSGASLGGTSPAHDLTITINNIVTTSGARFCISITFRSAALTNHKPLLRELISRLRTPQLRPQLLLLTPKKQIKFRNSYLASKELALLDSLNNISTQTTSSDLLVN